MEHIVGISSPERRWQKTVIVNSLRFGGLFCSRRLSRNHSTTWCCLVVGLVVQVQVFSEVHLEFWQLGSCIHIVGNLQRSLICEGRSPNTQRLENQSFASRHRVRSVLSRSVCSDGGFNKKTHPDHGTLIPFSFEIAHAHVSFG